jgi:hypothetical protein
VEDFALRTNNQAVLPSETAQFSAIIDGILAHSDLDTVSAKAIRKELAAKLDLNLDDKRVGTRNASTATCS